MSPDRSQLIECCSTLWACMCLFSTVSYHVLTSIGATAKCFPTHSACMWLLSVMQCRYVAPQICSVDKFFATLAARVPYILVSRPDVSLKGPSVLVRLSTLVAWVFFYCMEVVVDLKQENTINITSV